MLAVVIASVAFQNFKVLRHAQLALRPFNLVIGPNGSGKTSLIQSLLRLRTLSQLEVAPAETPPKSDGSNSPRITFRFDAPHEKFVTTMFCVSDVRCDALSVSPMNDAGWPQLRDKLGGIRAFLFDHYAMARPAKSSDSKALAANGGNMGAVLARMQSDHPELFDAVEEEFFRLMPEFSEFAFKSLPEGTVELALAMSDGSGLVTADDLSQGSLYLLGVLVLVFQPNPPSVVCIEEIDRGIHPRMLREVRDLLYRLSYPESGEGSRQPVQVIATTHSPYLLDLFREHPEEVVISQKEGNAAQFECLADRSDLAALLSEGSLGDIWFSGILGGVPEER